MPSSQESNGENPSKLGLLERFRFLTNKDRPSSVGAETLSSSSSANGSQDSQLAGDSQDSENLATKIRLSLLKSAFNEAAKSRISMSPEKNPNGVTFIPETPDHMLSHSSTDDKNGCKARPDSPSDSEEIVVTLPKKKVKRVLMTDSESDSDDKKAAKKVKFGAEDPKPVSDRPTMGNLSLDSACIDIYTDKEKSLRTLMKTFPKTDLMKMQDTLVKCDWHLSKAIHELQESSNPSDSPNNSATEPLNDELSPLNSKAKNDTVLFTVVSDTSDARKELGSLGDTGMEPNSVTSSQSTYVQELENAVNEVPLSQDNLSDSDSEHADTEKLKNVVKDDRHETEELEGSESPIGRRNNMKQKNVRQRIHQLSSDSDSDGNNSDVQIISMASLEGSPKNNRNSKATYMSKEGVEIISMASLNVVPSDKRNFRKHEHELSSEGEEEEEREDRNESEPTDRKKKKKKRKKGDLDNVSDDGEDFAQDELYNSDDSDIDDELNPAREAVLNFFRHASDVELLSVPGCSKKKVESIINTRPLEGWADLVKKLQTSKSLSTDMLGAARDVIVTREVMTKLMQKCEKIASDMEKVVVQMNSRGAKGNCIKNQPAILNTNMKLSPYQMLGLNWLWVMHCRKLNGILADEMGLGKTVQAIAFLSHLKMTSKRHNKHLIIVPSSTLDNWLREIQTWCPSMEVVTYHGSQEQRRELRLQLINDELEDFDIMVTTYNMISSSPEDRTLFRRLEFLYVVFDEAHMLKNMNTQRYQNLMKIKAERRLLLTGTPLQNNLVELMSLLIFVMPEMFKGKIEQVKQMFASACKSEENRSDYEKDRIEHAKRIMKPFVLRRLKREVLRELPTKHEEVLHCDFTQRQKEVYTDLVKTFTKRVSEEEKKDQGSIRSNGTGMMMELRKAANHPLLLRRKYKDSMLREMSKKLLSEPVYIEASADLIYEDMEVMSDFELHKLCTNFKSIASYKLVSEDILDSGKFEALDNLLPEMKEKGGRFLLFSQFTMMLDVVEAYMAIRNYSFLRLDGSTPVSERQELMDRFNGDPEIFAFLLSTKAGGLGINLTSANVVILHDIDFNPYNDKQAEDRCHRLGQTREVTVKKLIMKESIEEAIMKCAMDKLKLERDITANNKENSEEDVKTVGNLLKSALGL